MKRIIARWIIDDCVDRSRSLPSWVEKAIANDAELQKHARQTHLMCEQLRQDADAWAAGDALDPTDGSRGGSTNPVDDSPAWTTHDPLASSVLLAPQRHSTTMARGIAAALAASVLVATIWVLNSPEEKADAPEAMAMAMGRDHRAPDSQVDLRPLLATAAATQRIAQRVSSGSRSLFAKATAIPNRLGMDQAMGFAVVNGADIKSTSNDVIEAVGLFTSIFTDGGRSKSELPDEEAREEE